jgi:DNA-dependent RNA polymerase auxiliary subunit epsilon
MLISLFLGYAIFAIFSNLQVEYQAHHQIQDQSFVLEIIHRLTDSIIDLHLDQESDYFDLVKH